MKKQSRPFMVEVRKRRTTPAGGSGGADVAVQERTETVTRDIPSRSDLSYEEARRAADRVFGRRPGNDSPPEASEPETPRERLFRQAALPDPEPARAPRILESLLEASPEPVVSAVPEAPPRRGRGRPRKNPLAIPEVKVPKKRGRPPGSKSKPKDKVAAAAPAAVNPPPAAAAQAAKAQGPSARKRPDEVPLRPGQRWMRRLRHLR